MGESHDKLVSMCDPTHLRSLLLLTCLLFPRLLAADDAVSGEKLAYFEKHIRPLLIEHCYSCHSIEADAREGELLLDSRSGWTIGGQSGPAIVPGDAAASLLIRAVRYEDPAIQMPPEAKLDARQIALLERWVQSGAADPRQSVDAHDAARDGMQPKPSDPIAGRDHWTFTPLSRPTPPPVASPRWPRSAIDSFVLAKLEAEGLSPSQDADRRTLIRRLSFLLLGLPPSAEAVEQFERDTSPNAYPRLVDSMLSSPEFGQRWGRHWLDLARYADSNGLDENFLFREAWRYRNWVIDSVNVDIPLDQFVLQQIAGDLMPFESIQQRDRQRIASGFLVIGPKVLLGNDPRQRRMDVADEQLDTIGKTFLGMTLGCARCHDHKFDPVPTSDYYAMAGIMTSTEVLETRYMLGQQRMMEQLIGLGEDGHELDRQYEEYWRRRPKLQERLGRAKEALKHLKKEEDPALAELVEKHPDSLAPETLDEGNEREVRVAAQTRLIERLTGELKPPPIPPRAMVPTDVDSPADEAVRLAGHFDRRGEVVRRGTLRVIDDEPLAIPDGSSGRLELARWLADVDRGAGRVVARVIANRVWYHLMGQGLVRTVDNFGRTGEPPSHPDLLDYLAIELIDADWSIKSLVRKIVTSRSFMISSQHEASSHVIDPENRLLWRANRRRLEPEALRDAMLWAGGQLDLAPMDSTVWYLGDQATAVGANKNRRRTDFPCRSVYLPVIRNDLPELFDSFDFADPHATTGMRPQTMVASQGLFLMNDDSVIAAADAIARRALEEVPSRSPDEIAQVICRRLLSGCGSEVVRGKLVEFVEAWRGESVAAVDDDGDDVREDELDPVLQAWSAACQALLASSRFQILE